MIVKHKIFWLDIICIICYNYSGIKEEFKVETLLTKNIKKAIHHFKPIMGKMRTIRYADEVWTETGIVDSIRFEDYILDEQSFVFCGAEAAGVKPVQETCDKCKPKGCSGCAWRRTKQNPEMGIMVTCYEVKITVSDFKSNHGHNFVGNHNYYVVPSSIVKDILPLVPANVGVIQYSEETGSLRIKKEAVYVDISDTTKMWLLHNALKKWCEPSDT